LFLLRYQL